VAIVSHIQACCSVDSLSQFFQRRRDANEKDTLMIKLGVIAKIVSSKTAQQTKSFD